MNKKEREAKVKKLGGMLRIVPENDGQYKVNEQGCMFDGFEGVILIHCWDTDEWALIEGFHQQDAYRTNHLATVPDKVFEEVTTVQQSVQAIKKVCRKLMDKYPRFREMGYPEIAVDTAIAEHFGMVERFA